MLEFSEELYFGETLTGKNECKQTHVMIYGTWFLLVSSAKRKMNLRISSRISLEPVFSGNLFAIEHEIIGWISGCADLHGTLGK